MDCNINMIQQFCCIFIKTFHFKQYASSHAYSFAEFFLVNQTLQFTYVRGSDCAVS